MEEVNKNGWEAWSKHVLLELERLNDNIEGARVEIQELKIGVSRMKGIHYGLEELKEWKKEMSEVISPSQLKEMKDDVSRALMTTVENQKSLEEIDDIKEWKERIDEVASPTQIKELTTEIDKLKTFKTISTTAWVIVQILMALAIGFRDYIFN